jgi:hypothetical protein
LFRSVPSNSYTSHKSSSTNVTSSAISPTPTNAVDATASASSSSSSSDAWEDTAWNDGQNAVRQNQGNTVFLEKFQSYKTPVSSNSSSIASSTCITSSSSSSSEASSAETATGVVQRYKAKVPAYAMHSDVSNNTNKSGDLSAASQWRAYSNSNNDNNNNNNNNNISTSDQSNDDDAAWDSEEPRISLLNAAIGSVSSGSVASASASATTGGKAAFLKSNTVWSLLDDQDE